MNNYRPNSVLSAISKVFESIIYNQLYDYLQTNNLLSKFQSGFRKFHSTAASLLDATMEWPVNMDNIKKNSVIFLDLSKASTRSITLFFHINCVYTACPYRR